EGTLQVRPELPDEGAVTCPPEVLGEEHGEERGGVYGAVVRDEGNLPAGGHLTASELVEDAPGLLVGEGIVARALVSREEPERTPRDLRLERQELEGRDQAVAPEGGDVPRDARIGHEAGGGLRHQHVQIPARAAQPPAQPFVGGGDAGGVPRAASLLLLPAADDFGQAQRLPWIRGMLPA